ncbi:hypothetical protein FDECE_10026 [Fusarium decemcellulare]|nr:hypothetical protein FDECE_10026 [Fusarium decemcellulare]
MRVVPATAASTDYATLSYVWGNHLDVAPNETIDMMPKVIEDTALLVRKLGIRYLWVDRYCIPQNDTAAKHCQIQSMGDIYSQSMLTIISAAGSDPSQGLPGKRDLSFDDDALHAMAGIFAAFRKLKQPVQFVCGLPIFSEDLLRANRRQHALLEALSWDETALRRRPQFPSWTWLGWKSTRDEESSGFEAHPPYFRYLSLETAQSYGRLFLNITAKFEYRDGTVLDWETSYASVLELDSQSHHPARLRLAGWTFRGKVCWNGTWRFVAPFACLKTAHQHSLRLFHKSNVMEDASSCDVLAFLLRASTGSFIDMLLFREIHRDDIPDSKHATFGDLELEWAEIVIV